MLMKNSNDTIENRTRYLPTCSAVLLAMINLKKICTSDKACLMMFVCFWNTLSHFVSGVF